VLDWHERFVCSKCGSHEIDMVVTGMERPPGVDENPDAAIVSRSAGVVGP
jgi:hypothetical protein